MRALIKFFMLQLLFSIHAFSQNTFTVQSQNTDHATIAGVQFRYKSVPQGSIAPNTPIQVQGIPEGIVTFKPNTDVAKVYLKIVTTVSNTVLYNVNYQLSSSTVTSNEGKKLFENNDGSVFLSNGQAMDLKPYLYLIQTEDSEGNRSSVYSVIQ
jgi:hypothetical protein